MCGHGLLTRYIGVMVSQYIQISNHFVVHMKLIEYVNYTSIKKRGISQTCPNYSYNMWKFIIFGKKKMLVTYMTFHSPAQKDIPIFNNSPNQTVRKAVLTRSHRRGHKFPDSKSICKLKENIHPKWKLKRVLRNNTKGFLWWSSG